MNLIGRPKRRLLTNEGNAMNDYEAMMILPERLKEDQLDKALDGVVGQVKLLGGNASKPTKLGRRPFAREMQKQTSGEYALMRFQLPSDQISELHAKLKLNEDVFRVQVIRSGI